MADSLEPNDLSHLSDEEFHALCPIGEHAPGPEPLSPAAQAVLDSVALAMEGGWISPEFIPYEARKAAVALRAAADQVAPEKDCPDTEEWLGQSAWTQAESGVRLRLLAIAAELEGANG